MIDIRLSTELFIRPLLNEMSTDISRLETTIKWSRLVTDKQNKKKTINEKIRQLDSWIKKEKEEKNNKRSEKHSRKTNKEK